MCVESCECQTLKGRVDCCPSTVRCIQMIVTHLWEDWTRDPNAHHILPSPLFAASASIMSAFRALKPQWRVATHATKSLWNANESCILTKQTVSHFSTTLRWNNENTNSETMSTPTPKAAAETEPIHITLPGQSTIHPSTSNGKTNYMYSPTKLPPKQDPLLQFFVNLLMRDGKKASAERYIADMLAYIAKLTNSDPLPVVYEAVELARPILRMQTRKQGGKNMQVPIPLNERQSTRRALKWIIDAGNKRSDRSISRRLAVEILAVVEGNSSVLSRKEEQHKVGMINRANASVRI